MASRGDRRKQENLKRHIRLKCLKRADRQHGAGKARPLKQPRNFHGHRREPYDVPCPCGAICEPVKGDVIYPHRSDLHGKNFYLCRQCGRYCGTHPDTWESLGRPANPNERRLRGVAHAYLDGLWAYIDHGKGKARGLAYQWLREAMRMTEAECHIGMFDVDQLNKAIALLETELKKRNLQPIWRR